MLLATISVTVGPGMMVMRKAGGHVGEVELDWHGRHSEVTSRTCAEAGENGGPLRPMAGLVTRMRS